MEKKALGSYNAKDIMLTLEDLEKRLNIIYAEVLVIADEINFLEAMLKDGEDMVGHAVYHFDQ